MNYQLHVLPVNFSVFPLPSGLTCRKYLQPMLDAGAPGYLQDPNSSTLCAYCPINNGDAFLQYQLNLVWSDRWRDFGILCLFLAFNWFMLFVWFYLRSRSKKQKRA